MKISAIVPLYNGEKYIFDTLKSLEKQTYPLHEIIVVNDCSTDRSEELVNQFISESRVKVRQLQNETNRGVSYSRNRGVNESSGEMVLFIDADDLASEQLTQSHMKLWQEADPNHRWVLSHSAFQQMDENGIVGEAVFRFKQVNPEEILGYEIVRNYVYLSGTMVNKRAFLQAKGFDESLTLCEDWDLWLRLAQRGGFLYRDEPLALIRRHSGNASRTIESVEVGERKVLEKYSVDFLRQAISNRRLSKERNVVDFVSVMYRLDQWEIGYENIKMLLASIPHSIPGHFFMGIYQVRLKAYREAIITFNRALSLDPNRCEILNNIGACHMAIGQREEAMEFLSRATKLLPNYLDACNNLSTINKGSKNAPRFTWRELRPVLLSYG